MLQNRILLSTLTALGKTMAIAAAIRRKTLHGFTIAVSFLLIVLHAVGPSQLKGLHQVLHSHDHLVSHSEAEEKDPCHNAIYHQDTQKECGHHSHIVVKDNCGLCDLISHTDQILFLSVGSSSVHFFTVDFVICSPDISESRQSGLSSRAPPTV